MPKRQFSVFSPQQPTNSLTKGNPGTFLIRKKLWSRDLLSYVVVPLGFMVPVCDVGVILSGRFCDDTCSVESETGLDNFRK